MARPRNETPNFRLWLRGGVYYIRWWEDDAWKCVSTRTTIRSEASQVLAKFVAGQGTPAPPLQPTIGKILDGYLADRKPAVRAFATLEYACAALRRHLGDLEPDRLTKERSRHYVRERRREGHLAGSPSARRHKPTQDGTILRELVTLRAALRWAVKAKWIA